MADHIRVTKAPGTWVVRAGGAVIGETAQALELVEGDATPVIYFPRGDIAMAFLEAGGRVSHSPYIGEATFFSIVTKSRNLPDAAWSYEAPKEAVARIRGHIAFYTGDDLVTVEEV